MTENYPEKSVKTPPQSLSLFQQGQMIELPITDLSDSGEGVGRSGEWVIFVPDTIPGDVVSVSLVHLKRNYGIGKLMEILEPSPHRIRPRCIVADKCGGCQWQHISDQYQSQTKENLVKQTLTRIGGFPSPLVNSLLTHPQGKTLNYRNKVTYPLGVSQIGQVQGGYYQKNSHRLINLNQCPVEDSGLNLFLKEIKQDIQNRGWSVYNEKHHRGELRHLSLRIGQRTGEVLLTLIARTGKLSYLELQAKEWLEIYPELVGVCLNYNPDKTNVIFGKKTECIAGQSYLTELFDGLEFRLKSDTFFQINTPTAEALLFEILAELQLTGNEQILDAYCGVGTFTLPLAKRVKYAWGFEIQKTAIEQAEENAKINGLNHVTFQQGSVENLLPQLTFTPDILLLDPPRKGCDRSVLQAILTQKPKRIVYISCKPATLARDLKILCESGLYELTRVQPADFFPQTSHVEAVGFLTLRE